MQSQRPSEIEIEGINGGYFTGRIIYSDAPAGIYSQLQKSERLVTAREAMRLRVESFQWFLIMNPGVERCLETLTCEEPITEDLRNALESSRQWFNDYSHLFDIWKIRLTTSTAMVRARTQLHTETTNQDAVNMDKVCFYDGNPFSSQNELLNAMQGTLSDGGIKYSDTALLKILNHAYSQMPYSAYLRAKGGNFSSEEFYYHPIFSETCPDAELRKKYITALQVLSIFDFYSPNMHSIWRPGEMKSGYGRPIALGFKADAFYPPNNSTVDHAALAVKKDLDFNNFGNA